MLIKSVKAYLTVYIFITKRRDETSLTVKLERKLPRVVLSVVRIDTMYYGSYLVNDT